MVLWGMVSAGDRSFPISSPIAALALIYLALAILLSP